MVTNLSLDFRIEFYTPFIFLGFYSVFSCSAAQPCQATFVTSPEGVETLKVRRFPHPTIDEILDNCPGNDFKAPGM